MYKDWVGYLKSTVDSFEGEKIWLQARASPDGDSNLVLKKKTEYDTLNQASINSCFDSYFLCEFMPISLQCVQEWYVKTDLLDLVMWVEIAKSRFGKKDNSPYHLPSELSDAKEFSKVPEEHFSQVNP